MLQLKGTGFSNNWFQVAQQVQLVLILIKIKNTFDFNIIHCILGVIELVGGELVKGNVYVDGNQGFIVWFPDPL